MDDARFVFNLGLEQRSFWRREKHDRGSHPEHGSLDAVRITKATQMRELTRLRVELPWLRAGSSSVQQAALRDLDQAFANFYAGRARYPVFKRRDDRVGGFVVRDFAVRRLNRRWGTVTVPKVGRVRFRLSRSWAEITQGTSARITLRHGRWHVALTTPPAAKVLSGSESTAGIDRGVRNTLATSDGRMFQAPALTAVERARLLLLERRLTRQTKHVLRRKNGGSRRRQATLDQMAVLRRRLANRRTDWIEQTTTRLASGYALIAVEDLRVRNMVRRPATKPDPDQPGAFLPNGSRAKSGLNRSILASLWGRFQTRLEDKMGSARVVRVNPTNTSRTCAACGHCAPGNRESQAVFECEACGHLAHADTNAAVVILNRALSSLPAAGHAVSGRRSPAPAGSANQPAA
ncbi:RNA-guided endonuclease InsQ/TnpB family protein [Kribbella sp. CA-293567]|uniref:RNA-guided endonuclease InsQ/TnpB family protein n=1 Tax=Kribbella sp. CA-293567 TaxID=3002436 RepID=UPI0022DD9B36|nr:transposase [Kribbella sp. CA-293567]WBQ08714.1 transposase [Kribbella sp. CA-293567]